MRQIDLLLLFCCGLLCTLLTINYTAIAQHYSSPFHAIVPLQKLNIPPATIQGETTVNLQFLDNSRVFTLPVKVGEISGDFLLDTGASTTLVSSSLVQQLGLEGKSLPGEELPSAVAGDDCQEMKALLHQLPRLQINQVEVENLTGLEFKNTIIPGKLSGVLGMDILKHFDVTINPKTQQLQLISPSKISFNSQSSAIPLQGKLGVMLAQVEINNQGVFPFMLDTGADLIFISQTLAKQLKLDQGTIQPIQVQGFCGLEDAEYSVLEQVKINPFQQENLAVVILSSPSVLDLLGVDGILGQNFFQFYQQHWQFNPDSSSETLAGQLMLKLLEGY